MKTIGIMFGIWIALAGPLAALTEEPRERVQIFATCLGRASAEMEHRWLMGDSGEPEQHRRVMFEQLLDMIAPRSGVSGAVILDMRIRAKIAHARRLQIASFHTDPKRKQRAAVAARQAMLPCNLLVIS